MKRVLPILFYFSFCMSVSAQVAVLDGTPIGSPSVDYNTGTVSTTENIPQNAFDNDVETIYASYQRSNGWVGLDLGKKYVIRRISYCPRNNYANRMMLGVFEGANQPDFSDAIPIYMIQSNPIEGKFNIKTVYCSRGFRYVRYVGPNDSRCNVSGLRFYGVEGEGDDSQLYQMTNLPLLVVHTKDEQDVTSKEVYMEGILSVISEEGKTFYTDTLNIRGRGNASWLYPKKPYKIKLNNKTHLLNLPAKDKTWTLINNWGDKTLIRNLVSFEVSRRMKMDYTPAGTLVNLMLNGEFKGCYQLCDQIEVDKNRIDITKMDETCTSIPEITGGYLIEIDAYASGEPKHFTSTNGTPVTIKYPDSDVITTEQFNYIKNKFNTMESAVNSYYYLDNNIGYAKTLDVDPFLKYFLLGEYDGNTDTYWSVYMSKDRGSTTKFKCAAVWDSDLAFENDQRTYPINDLTTYLSYSDKSSSAGNMKTFVRRVVNSQSTRLKELWNEARNKNGFTWKNMEAYVDSLAEVIDESQNLNFKRWPILDERVHQNFQALGSYQAEVDFMKSYMKDRFDWMDNKIGYEPILDGVNAETQLAGNVLARNGHIYLYNFAQGTKYAVYTIEGKMLREGTVSAASEEINAAAGIYVVKANMQNEVMEPYKVLVK